MTFLISAIFPQEEFSECLATQNLVEEVVVVLVLSMPEKRGPERCSGLRHS
jgi:hypothetical protein